MTDLPNRRWSPAWLRCVQAGTLAAVVIALVIWILVSEIFSRRDERCRNNLKQIGLALHAYHQTHGSFPPQFVADETGNLQHSWRVLLLPQLGEQELYDSYHFDEPWNGPNNSKLAQRMPSVFACPKERRVNSGKTSYVGLAGPATPWRGIQATSMRDITAGTSNIAAMVEVEQSDIEWLEPRDLTTTTSGEWVLYQLWGQQLASRHSGGGHVLSWDGTARRIPRPPEAPMPPAEEFPAETSAAKLAETDVVPHTEAFISDGRNQVYCATFLLAWKELQVGLLKAPLQLSGSPPLADTMNLQTFAKSNLSPASYVALAGLTDRGIVNQIRAEMTRKFPAAPQELIPSTANEASTVILAFAYLEKSLPFKKAFDNLERPLFFQTRTGQDVPVASFGVREFLGNDVILSNQASILDYVAEDNFVVRLTSMTDEIVVAKVPPQGSLRDTLRHVQERAAESTQKHASRKLDKGDTLVIPKMVFNIRRTYSELIGCQLQNPGWEGLPIAHAFQVIRFRLNERGAKLVSVAEIAVSNGHPPQPGRRMIFNRPFLLYLKEVRAEEPYLAIWFETAELFEKP